MRFYYLGQFNSNGISNLLNVGSTGSIFDPTISSLVPQISLLLPERNYSDLLFGRDFGALYAQWEP